VFITGILLAPRARKSNALGVVDLMATMELTLENFESTVSQEGITFVDF
jgi:hypothetical protein